MVRSIPGPAGVASFNPAPITPLSIGLFVSVVALVSLCARHYRVSNAKKTESGSLEGEPKLPPRSPMRAGRHAVPYEPWDYEPDSKLAPRSPLASPKAFFTTLSHKAIPIFHAKRAADEKKAEDEEQGESEGVWKRKILMGERCQPPDFSGVIYYDHTGKQVPELPPRSPCKSSPSANFSFPIIITQESPDQPAAGQP